MSKCHCRIQNKQNCLRLIAAGVVVVVVAAPPSPPPPSSSSSSSSSSYELLAICGLQLPKTSSQILHKCPQRLWFREVRVEPVEALRVEWRAHHACLDRIPWQHRAALNHFDFFHRGCHDNASLYTTKRFSRTLFRRVASTHFHPDFLFISQFQCRCEYFSAGLGQSEEKSTSTFSI